MIEGGSSAASRRPAFFVPSPPEFWTRQGVGRTLRLTEGDAMVIDSAGMVWTKPSRSNGSGDCVEVGVPLTWCTSSRSNGQGQCVEVGADVPAWQTSSRSGGNGSCVEVARNLPAVVAVRDSKDRGGPMLAFSPEMWARFTAAVKGGRFG